MCHHPGFLIELQYWGGPAGVCRVKGMYSPLQNQIPNEEGRLLGFSLGLFLLFILLITCDSTVAAPMSPALCCAVLTMHLSHTHIHTHLYAKSSASRLPYSSISHSVTMQRAARGSKEAIRSERTCGHKLTNIITKAENTSASACVHKRNLACVSYREGHSSVHHTHVLFWVSWPRFPEAVKVCYE